MPSCEPGQPRVPAQSQPACPCCPGLVPQASYLGWKSLPRNKHFSGSKGAERAPALPAGSWGGVGPAGKLAQEEGKGAELRVFLRGRNICIMFSPLKQSEFPLYPLLGSPVASTEGSPPWKRNFPWRRPGGAAVVILHGALYCLGEQCVVRERRSIRLSVYMLLIPQKGDGLGGCSSRKGFLATLPVFVWAHMTENI